MLKTCSNRVPTILNTFSCTIANTDVAGFAETDECVIKK